MKNKHIEPLWIFATLKKWVIYAPNSSLQFPRLACAYIKKECILQSITLTLVLLLDQSSRPTGQLVSVIIG